MTTPVSSNIQPLALSAEEAKQLQQVAKSVWHHALVEVSRGLSPGKERAVRRELGLAMYRLAIEEFDGVPEEAPEPALAQGSGSASRVELWHCTHGIADTPCKQCFTEESPWRGEP